MHITPCEHPKRIWNKYLREFQTVPCGKCNTCRVSHSMRWVTRLKDECRCHNFSVFFTLTYNEQYLPRLVRNYDFDVMSVFVGVRTSFSLSLDELDRLDSDSYKYLMRVPYLGVLNPRDVTLFIKRFRRKIDYLNETRWHKSTSPCIRYYIAGEYGETTLRPHYHGIMWFDDKEVFENFESLLIESWSDYDRHKQSSSPLGNVDWSPVQSNAASYVAQYLNCLSNLPSLLTDSKVRPFFVSSRRPPVGSLPQFDASVQEIFHKGLIGLSVSRGNGEAPLLRPLLPSFRDRLFPKLPRFVKIPHALRVTLYGIYDRFSREKEACFEIDSYDEYLKGELKYLFYKNKNLGLVEYLKEICCYLDTSGWFDVKPFRKLCDMSARVLAQASSFGVSLDYYVTRIEQYYSNLAAYNNRSWFAFSEDFSKKNNQLMLISSDMEFTQKIFAGVSINEEMKSAYGLNSLTHDNEFYLSYDSNPDYANMTFLYSKIVKDTSKTKRKNDYLDAHPERKLFVY